MHQIKISTAEPLRRPKRHPKRSKKVVIKMYMYKAPDLVRKLYWDNLFALAAAIYCKVTQKAVYSSTTHLGEATSTILEVPNEQ